MKNKHELWIVIIALLATAAKLYCAATTIGTIDVGLYYKFAKFIAKNGVIAIYGADPTFNHPPLLGNYLGLAFQWAGGIGPRFAFFHRLPGIVADLLVVLIFLQLQRKTGKPSWWALGLLAASPISFMISGYHGNYDPLIALGLTLAAAACVYQRPALCGVFLGLTCQVKIIPILLAPALFFFWWHRGRNRAALFGAAAAATVLIGWSGPLIGAPEPFLKHVLAYNSTWGWWGFSYLLNISGIPAFDEVSSAFAANPVQGAVINAMKLIVIGGALLIAWRRRKCEEDGIFATIALTWAVFLFFAPGFGVQYLAWVSPFFLRHSERWFAIYTAAASAALFAFYHTISGGHIPWMMGSRMEALMGIWRPWLLLPWVVFGIYLVMERRAALGLGAEKKVLQG
jgi:hypothetical protein